MKKIVFYSVLMLCFLSLVGCSKRKEISIVPEEISVNTMLVRYNGEVQVAYVEQFDKEYYKLMELEEFVQKEISAYNEKLGTEEVTKEKVLLKDGKAIMVLTFSGMDQYTAFNDVSASYFKGGIDIDTLKGIPDTYVNEKNKSSVSKDTALKNAKYKVLVVNEAYDIIVDGKIKYYTPNATLVDDDKIQSASDEMTVVVFKP